ncbi:MAG: hypothetical protein IJS45_00025 [Clostridia bacterium]|nr:hypothetical protein [Clostridia bacterium]
MIDTKYEYKYEINEFGVIILNDLPYKNRFVEVPRENRFRMLYSYALIDIDLHYAINYLELCNKATRDIERQCFFRMAVIQYAKCYSPSKNGGRPQLDASKVYKNIPDDPIGCHNKFLIMRNKYFAHDENDFKSSKLGAVLNVDDHKLMGIAYPKMQAKFDYDINITILKTLCQKSKEWVNVRLDNELEKLHKYIEIRGFDVLNGYNELSILNSSDKWGN